MAAGGRSLMGLRSERRPLIAKQKQRTEVRDVPLDSSGANAGGDVVRLDRFNESDDATSLDGVTAQDGATGLQGAANPTGCDLPAASDGDVATGGLGTGGAAATGSSASNKGNEAKLDENVSTSQTHEPVDVVADFGDGQGLDNVAVECRFRWLD